MKEDRRRLIAEIITERNIGTQSELVGALLERGVRATQATVSRDIRELRLIKEPSGAGTYRYCLPREPEEDMEAKLRAIFRECVTGFVCAQNIVVLRTLPGFASAACVAIDKMHIKDMAGTIAGDDTAFIAMRDNESAGRFCEEIKTYF